MKCFVNLFIFVTLDFYETIGGCFGGDASDSYFLFEYQTVVLLAYLNIKMNNVEMVSINAMFKTKLKGVSIFNVKIYMKNLIV